LESIRALDEPVCSICGERLLSPFVQEGDARCGECLQQQRPYTKAVAYGGYEGGLRDLIHLLKYERVRPAAAVLGRMISECLVDLAPQFGEEPPLVVPVPLHDTKLRQRGFNQSELVVRAALKVSPFAAELNTSALVRKRPTESQTGLTRYQRRLNIRGAFAVVAPNQVTSRDIVLVDDVFTTGTTVSECATVLRRAGANRVFVATVARVLKPEGAQAEPEFGQETEEAAQGRAAHA
jgi:ComF family protein